MKRVILIVIGILGVLWCVPASAHAQSTTPVPAVRVDHGEPVRNGPGSESAIIGSLAAGTVMQVTGCDTDCSWLEVGPSIWIAASQVTPVIAFFQPNGTLFVRLPAAANAAAPLPTPVPLSTEVVPPTPTSLPAIIAETKTGTALTEGQIYRGPVMNLDVVGTVTAGQSLTIVGKTLAGDWYQLADGNWILAYIVDSQRSSSIAAATPPTAAPSISAPPTAASGAMQVVEAPAAQSTAAAAPALTPAPATSAVQVQGQIAPTCYDIMVAYNTMTSVQWNVFEKQNRYTWMKGWTGNIALIYSSSGSFYNIGIELADGCRVNVTTSQEEALKYSDGQTVIFDGQIENMSTGLLGGLFINTIASTVVLRPLN